MNLTSAVDDHTALFNRSVRSGDFAAFVATFADDAVMRFANVPAGPFVGRAAIAAAYAAQPLDDTMTVGSVEEIDPNTARARFAWDAGGDGTMVLRWRDGQVAELEIRFD
jgi:ketosteroid isomerase-like protein